MRFRIIAQRTSPSFTIEAKDTAQAAILAAHRIFGPDRIVRNTSAGADVYGPALLSDRDRLLGRIRIVPDPIDHERAVRADWVRAGKPK